MSILRTLPIVAALTVAFALTLVGSSWADPSAKTVGKPVKTFAVTAVTQFPVRKYPVQHLSGRVILLQFFSTYSQREVDAVPHLNKLRDTLGPKGLTILGITSADAKKMSEWMTTNKARYPACCVDSDAYDELINFYQYPGMPWSYLVDLSGTIVWQGHPQALKAPKIATYLKGASKAPLLPLAWESEQTLLDTGVWGAAREKLTARAAETTEDKKESRRLQGWARAVVKWIETRSTEVFDEAAAHEKSGAWWDAWEIYDNFPKRFAGLDGAERAATAAAAVRANEAAKADLELGDRVARAALLMRTGKAKKAKLIISRIVKKHKKSRHATRCRALLNPLE